MTADQITALSTALLAIIGLWELVPKKINYLLLEGSAGTPERLTEGEFTLTKCTIEIYSRSDETIVIKKIKPINRSVLGVHIIKSAADVMYQPKGFDNSLDDELVISPSLRDKPHIVTFHVKLPVGFTGEIVYDVTYHRRTDPSKARCQSVRMYILGSRDLRI